MTGEREVRDALTPEVLRQFQAAGEKFLAYWNLMTPEQQARWWERRRVADSYRAAVRRGHSYPIGAVR